MGRRGRQALISSEKKRASRFLVIGCALLTSVTCVGYRQDEIECEEAVAHLSACCPGFDSRRIFCGYVDNGCEHGATTPDFGTSQSKCLRRASCDALVASNACAIGTNTPPLQTLCPQSED